MLAPCGPPGMQRRSLPVSHAADLSVRCHGLAACPVRTPSSRLTQRAPSAAAVSVDTEASTSAAPAIPIFPAPQAGHFAPDLTYFREDHRIRGNEAGEDQTATAVTISNLLQEVASNHAVGMWGRGDGFANMPSMKDLLFVMTRLQFRMHRYPRWGDIVSMETYFNAESRLTARRDWVIRDAATGEVIGGGTSTWVTINVATRRLAKLPEDLRSKFLKFSPPDTRNALPVEETKQKLPDIEVFEIQGPKQVARRSDMDMNGHINNVTYLAWALETVPEEVYTSHWIKEVVIDFKAECTANQLIETLATLLPFEPSNGNGNGNGNGSSGHERNYLHSIRRCDGDGATTELVRARTTWVPNKKQG